MTCNDEASPSLPTAHQAAVFLAEYASWLLGCGTTCIRIEKNVDRMVAAFGMQGDITIMPSHVQVAVWRGNAADARMAVRKVQRCGISFDLNARLSRLSWEVADGKADYPAARELFGLITRTRPTGKWEVLTLAGLANAVFCRLFGGDAVAMLLVFVSTLAGMHIVPASTVAAFVVGTLAVLCAPRIRCPAEVCFFPALLPMIPGMYAYRTIEALLSCLYHTQEEAFGHYFYLLACNGLTCASVVLGMVVGVTMPMFILKRLSFRATR